MEERFRRGKSEEEAKNGLVIELCLYGLLATEEGDLIADVTGCGEGAGDISGAVDITKPVQCNVDHSPPVGRIKELSSWSVGPMSRRGQVAPHTLHLSGHKTPDILPIK